ncbi:MAG TPA: AsmA family protein [Terriglobales bacterium]
MKKIFSRRAAVMVCVLLLALFVVRPRAGRLRGRVAESIAQAVGRHVEIGSLHLRFFPRPGFSLDNLVVRDDPAFGAEPLLRAPDVTAWLRVGAILHGRIEIASLSLSNASLNLTRDNNGKWNIEDLVERTAHTSLAPTAAGRANEGPSFPYIEAAHARINFKEGAEKIHFALTDSEFALWQDSRDTWGMRLKAAPIRTDANLTDTGVINVSGVWRRAANVKQTPVELAFEWKRGQIGQLSKLIYGVDKEWRGAVAVSGTAVGTPEKLKVAADGSLEDFRQRSVLGPGELRISVHCGAEFNLPSHEVSNLDCVAPAGAGFVEIKGGAAGPQSEHSPFSSYDLWMLGSKVPAEALLNAARQTNTNFPDDLIASGELNGSVEISRNSAAAEIHMRGSGSFRQLQFSAAEAGSEIALGTVPFTVGSAASNDHARRENGAARKKSVEPTPLEEQVHAVIGPVNLAMGRPAALQVRAVVAAPGYEASVKGEAGVKKLLQLAQLLRVPAPVVDADGTSTLDLAIKGGWNAERSEVRGTAQLHAVRAQIHGINGPLDIAGANLAIAEDAVRVSNLSADAAGAMWHGTLQIPRPCGSPDKCVFEFNIRTAELNAAAFNALVNPTMAKKSWYKILAIGQSPQNYLLQARGNGKVEIEKLALGKAECSHLTADLKLDAGEVTLTNLQGDVLEGHGNGDWKADFSKKPPEYSGTGSLQGIDLAQVAGLMHDSWIKGNGAATYDLSANGWTLQDLLDSAEMKATFTIHDGAFPHIVFSSRSGPLQAAEFSGEVHLQDGKLLFEDANLETEAGVYKVNGTALLTGALDLRLSGESASGYNVTGTLVKTRVTSTPTAEAELKP